MLSSTEKASKPLKEISPLQQHSYIGQLRREDYNEVSSVIEAGRRLDHSQVPFIIGLLQSPPHVSYATAGLHALAKIGALEGLPVVQTYIDTDTGDIGKYAVVVKARLLAESRTQNIADSKTLASTKVHTFFSQLGLSPADLNSQTVDYNSPQPPIASDGVNAQTMSIAAQKVHPVGVYAMRELADIVYHGQCEDFAILPEIKEVNFGLDYASGLKMRLAQVPQQNRLATIINELSHKTSLSFNDYYEIQLAVNEGTNASQAAADELRKMDKHRADYNQDIHHSGFTAMFQIIQGVGDKKQAPLFTHFKDDSDRFVAHYASIMYDDLAQGIKRESELAY